MDTILSNSEKKPVKKFKRVVKNLTPKLMECFAYDLMGNNGNEIAKLMGISQARVSTIRNSPAYKNLIENKRNGLTKQNKEIEKQLAPVMDPVLKILQEGAAPAAEKLVDKMHNSKSDTIQVDAAKNILDRTGYVAEKKVITRTVELSSEDAERITEAFHYTETRTRDNA